jgi:MarR family transcriptional regulator, organic hydroperoxide resistance regulator
MANRPKSSKLVADGHVSDSNRQRGAHITGRSQEAIQEFIWNIVSINGHFEEIRCFWAQILGISGPQWLILMATSELDRGDGVSVRAVSAKLDVDPSFVTTQTKSLEKHGFMRRIPSVDDARVVLMSLSDKACKQIASLSARQEILNEFIFSEVDDRELRDLNDKLMMLKNRLAKAPLRLAADI